MLGSSPQEHCLVFLDRVVHELRTTLRTSLKPPHVVALRYYKLKKHGIKIAENQKLCGMRLSLHVVRSIVPPRIEHLLGVDRV
jgi:hypothetical protein